jgi:photosystem II stability/assembly factor-like uncharacterized protein
MERRWWGGWKAGTAAGLVAAVVVAALLGVLLTRLSPSPRARRTAPPTAAPTAAPTPLGLHVPAGWKPVLPGLVVSDFSHLNTLVTSAAKPGRVAACALPPHGWPVSVAPVFVRSDDGGRTWQHQAVPPVGAVWRCDLTSDPLDPDMYAMSVIHIIDGKAQGPDEIAVTHDAGRTWRLEAMPATMLYSCATLPQQLNMPTWAEAQPCTVDPFDPTHHYAFITASATENRGLSLYETRDSGNSWRSLHTWPTAIGLRFMEIHPTSGGLYIIDRQDAAGGEGIYRSTDGGAAWNKLPVQGNGVGLLYFGHTGRIVTMEYPQVSQVDPVTGEPTPLGETPVIIGGNGDVSGIISAVAICEGSQPSLVVSGPFGTYVRSLPPLH